MDTWSNSFQSKENKPEDQSCTLEEIRQKRLAYFGSNKDERGTDGCKTPIALEGSGDLVSNEILGHSPSISYQSKIPCLPQQHGFSLASGNNNSSNSHNSYDMFNLPYLKNSSDSQIRSNDSTYQPIVNHKNLEKSEDFDKIPVFKSTSDLSELGLSTHRPESINNNNFLQTSEQRRLCAEAYGKPAGDQTLYGEQNFENPLVKKSYDFDWRGDPPPTHNWNSKYLAGQLPRTLSTETNDRRENIPGFLSPSSSVNKTSHKDKERGNLSLIRTSDQATVPKTARNSYSSEEIYREAYMYGKQFDTFDSNHIQSCSGSISQNWSHPPLNQYQTNQNVLNTALPEYPIRNPYTNMFSQPPPPKLPSYESQFSNEIPPQSSAYYFQKSGFDLSSQYNRNSNQGNLSHYAPESHHLFEGAYSNQSFEPQKSSRNATFSTSYNYDNLGTNPYVLKFPTNGVPLHLPPPPIPQFVNQDSTLHCNPQQYGPPSSAERNSISNVSQHPLPGYKNQDRPAANLIKVPHPPLKPPPLNSRDFSAEHRHTSPRHLKDMKATEENFNNCNLKRYFSSLDGNYQPAINSSRSASDPCHAIPFTSQSFEEDVYEKNEDDKSESMFTRVSDMTTASKAGGMTQRLLDLGVDLDHLRHLRVVSKKADQELEDAKFEKLSKGIRYCPECNAANKAYMDWCIECGEVLIGVEPSLPRGRKKMREEEKEKKRRNNLSKGVNKRELSKNPENNIEKDYVENDISTGYLPKNSPESGRGLSLSSSPVRYRREQSISPSSHSRTQSPLGHKKSEPKDSGRASIGEQEDDGTQDESRDQESHSDVFEQISDPVLKDFIISYRNRHMSKQKLPNEKFLEESKLKVNPQSDFSSTKEYDNSSHLAKCMAKTSKSLIENGNNLNNLTTNNDIYEKYDSSCDDLEVKDDLLIPVIKSSKKKKKKKKVLMDVEIFSYGESRQSRDSNRDNNVNVVPLLNFVRSSEEESCESVEDNDTDSDNIENNSKQDNYYHENKKQNDIDQENKLDSIQDESQNIEDQKKKVKPTNKFVENRYKIERQSASSAQSNACSLKIKHTPETTDQGGQRSKAVRGAAQNYDRHWARSSIAWSSYNPRELNTRSSINNYPGSSHLKDRPSSRGSNQGAITTEPETSQTNGVIARQRPSSAEYSHEKRKNTSHKKPRPSSASHNDNCQSMLSHESRSVSSGKNNYQGLEKNDEENSACLKDENFSPRSICKEMHRLTLQDLEEESPDNLQAESKTTYDKYQEMTPRIQEGELSMWQCLPDEIWLHIFRYLPQSNLVCLMSACHYFYRLTNDQTLWRYITVKPRFSLSDTTLSVIGRHCPVSVAMVKCQGGQVTLDGLHNFFQTTNEKLRELNICGCSQGCLTGGTVLSVAAKYCQRLTHLDASYCNLDNDSFLALSQCAARLESVCVNGFQSMSDSVLMALLKKHGKSLRTLELYACFSLTAAVLRSLGEQCLTLRRLCLGSCNRLTDSTMITLSTHLSRIEELDLRGCKNLRNESIRKIVKNCPRISTLVLANCQQISDPAVTEIATYLKTTLMSLDVCGCDKVSDEGVTNLAKNCDRLVSLDISSTKCSSVSVSQLANNGCNRWLESVKFSFLRNLSEASITNLIRQCSRLKLIHVFGCTSLRNLVNLRNLKSSLSIEGDIDVHRSQIH